MNDQEILYGYTADGRPITIQLQAFAKEHCVLQGKPGKTLNFDVLRQSNRTGRVPEQASRIVTVAATPHDTRRAGREQQ
jgi:hypothetical protein